MGRWDAIPSLRKKEPRRNNSGVDEHSESYVMIACQQGAINRNYGSNKFMVKPELIAFTALILLSLLVMSLLVALH